MGFLGLDRIVMFVDNHSQYTTCFYKEVISFDALADWTQKYLVMLAVIGGD